MRTCFAGEPRWSFVRESVLVILIAVTIAVEVDCYIGPVENARVQQTAVAPAQVGVIEL